MLQAVAETGSDGVLPFFEQEASRRGPYSIVDVSSGFIPMTGDGKNRLSRKYPPGLFEYLGNLPLAPAVTDRGRTEWRFGVVIGIGPSAPLGTEPPVAPFGPSALPRRTWSGQGPSFPILVEWRELNKDAPPNPYGAATSACYARPRPGKRYYSGKRWYDGILIARHVLLPRYATAGSSVPMSSGATAAVVDLDSVATTIDAAILDAVPPPPGLSPLGVVNAVFPGLQVSVSGAVSSFSADVLRVMDDSSYFGNMVAHRAFLDSFGQRGDSGSLVTDAAGEAVGLYIGSHPKSNPVEGIVQLMRQVTQYFEIDLFN